MLSSIVSTESILLLKITIIFSLWIFIGVLRILFKSNFHIILPFKSNFINEKIYSLNNNSDLKIYNLNDKKDIETHHVSISSNSDFFHPTSVAMLNNFFYAGYAEGTLIKFDINGNIIWQLELNDILKTPIKIHNENIIVILSNKILSVDTIDEKINWEFIYKSDNSLNVYGGDIVSKNHLLFFY